MTRPDGKQPFFVDPGTGVEWPLIVPRSMLEQARHTWPTMWIEASPTLSTETEL